MAAPAPLESPSTPANKAAPVTRPRQLFSPSTEEALQEEEDVLEEAKEEQDLYDELDLIKQQVIDPETENETREDMKLKLVRYKQIMNKKTSLIKEVGT